MKTFDYNKKDYAEWRNKHPAEKREMWESAAADRANWQKRWQASKKKSVETGAADASILRASAAAHAKAAPITLPRFSWDKEEQE